MDLPEALTRLDNLENALLAQISRSAHYPRRIPKAGSQRSTRAATRRRASRQDSRRRRWARSRTGKKPENPFRDDRQVSEVFTVAIEEMARAEK